MSGWIDSAAWKGGGLEREVFFFRGGDCDVYGSYYAGVAPSNAFGVVICPAWGVEEHSTAKLVRGLALRMAELGGAALVYHHPGSGDSPGDVAVTTMEDLRDAAVAAVAEAERRRPGTCWILVGLTLGAAVAALAWRRAAVGRLLFLQPSLDPAAYFDGLIRGARRARLGDPTAEQYVYGYPVPEWVRKRAAAEVSPGEALAGFSGTAALVRYEEPSAHHPVPGGLETITVPGRWVRGARDYPELMGAALDWLERITDGARDYGARNLSPC